MMDNLINGINDIIDEIHSNEREINNLSLQNKYKEIQVILEIRDKKDKIVDIINNNKEFLKFYASESKVDDIIEKIQNNTIENYAEAIMLIDLLNSVKEHNSMKKLMAKENKKSCEVSNNKKGFLGGFTDFMKG